MSEETPWEDVSGDGGVLKLIKVAASLVEGEGSDSSYPEEGEEVNINYTGILSYLPISYEINEWG